MGFEEENPWQAWISSHRSRWSSVTPDRGLEAFVGRLRDPLSASANQLSLQEVAIEYTKYEVGRVLEKIAKADSDLELSWLASYAFGTQCFSGGFLLSQRGLKTVNPLLELQRQMITAELLDHITGRVAWAANPSDTWGFGGPELFQVGHHLKGIGFALFGANEQLQRGGDARDALITEIIALFTPSEAASFLIRSHLSARAQQGWQAYEDSCPTHSTGNAYGSGVALGALTVELVNNLVDLQKEKGLSALLESAAPILNRWINPTPALVRRA